MLGRMDEALAEMRRAQELNPLSLIIRTHLGLMLYRGRRYDEAIEQLRRTLEMEPDFAAAHYFLGWAYEQKGMCEETLTHLQKALAASPGSPDRVGALGHAHAVFKRRGYAQKALKELHKLSERRFVSAYDFAIICVGLDEADQAFKWLERAYEERSFSMLMSLKAEPRLDTLRSDPRFQDLVRRVGLPPWASFGRRAKTCRPCRGKSGWRVGGAARQIGFPIFSSGSQREVSLIENEDLARSSEANLTDGAGPIRGGVVDNHIGVVLLATVLESALC
jgi:tetratricopeptide (TPR) repeat protein